MNIIESCHSGGAKLELIQFVTVSIWTLIKKDSLMMASVLICIVKISVKKKKDKSALLSLCQDLITKI